MDRLLAEATGEPLLLERLLELEDAPLFVELACPTTGVLAWPAIRLLLFRFLLGDLLYPTAPIVDLEHRPGLPRMAGGAIRAVVHNTLHRPRPSEVLFRATGAGLLPRNGRSFNRYVDHFAACLGDRAWTMESLFDDAWPDLPRANERVRYLADHRLARALQARAATRPVHRDLARAMVDLAARRGHELLGWELGEGRRDALADVGARRLAAYPVEAQFVRRILKGVRPRLVLAEEGCYGSMAVFNATARELGVTVAEFQHGLVTRGHDAYNVAPRLAASAAYRRTQPVVFLGYGEWWNSQFNAPVEERVAIGNPHRTETLRSWRGQPVRSTVVVLGDGVETESYLALCRRLAAGVRSPLEVVFRPHPLERGRVVDNTSTAGVRIDVESDLYSSLASAEVVIGEASTALFEAVGLVPRIFVWDTAKSRFYLGDHPFERFADAAELVELLAADEPGRVQQALTDALWADDWKERFQGFIDRSATA